jgi:hypothetical protein
MKIAQITASLALLAAVAAAETDQPARQQESVTVQGLQVTVVPTQPVFHPQTGPVFDVQFKNTTDAVMHLWDVTHYAAWKMKLGQWHRVITHIKSKRLPVARQIQAGKTLTVRVDLSKGFLFHNTNPRARATPQPQPPEGRHEFQAEIVIAQPPNPGGKTWWTGTIKTAPTAFSVSRNVIRPAATVPANLPIRAELIAGKTTIKMPPERLGPGYRRGLYERVRRGEAVPACELALSLKLTNTSDKPISLAVTGHMQRLDLRLDGPGTVLLPSHRPVARGAARSQRTRIAPAASVEIEIDGMYHGQWRRWATCWTETGVYRLQAAWRTSATGIDGVKPGATVTVITEPITLRVTDLEGKITPPVRPEDVRKRFQKLLAQLGDGDFRTREQATRQLIAAARTDPLIAQKLRQALGRGGLDAETQARIRHVLQAIASEPS